MTWLKLIYLTWWLAWKRIAKRGPMKVWADFFRDARICIYTEIAVGGEAFGQELRALYGIEYAHLPERIKFVSKPELAQIWILVGFDWDQLQAVLGRLKSRWGGESELKVIWIKPSDNDLPVGLESEVKWGMEDAESEDAKVKREEERIGGILADFKIKLIPVNWVIGEEGPNELAQLFRRA
ncbi:MAG: hypothetical protein AAB833_00780 [Patescibacteria group bacterium]